MVMVTIMYGAVAINAYINNVTKMLDDDGRCHFGIQGIVSIPFTVVTFTTDAVLTGVFFYLLFPVARPPTKILVKSTEGREADSARVLAPERPVQRNIRTLLWKSIIGSLLIEIPMAANMVQFVITKGEELGMICLLVCLLDGRSFFPKQIRSTGLIRNSVLGCACDTLAYIWIGRCSRR